MSKKILVLVCVAVLLAGGTVGYFLSARSGGKLDSLVPEGAFSGLQKVGIEGEEVYQDESGFSFKYPKGAEVKDVTPEDSEYYSVLEISHAQTRGIISISIRDTQSSSISDWVEKNLKEPKLLGAVSLGNIQAKQYEFSSEGAKLVTVAVDKGIIYEINSPGGNDFWEESLNLLLSSFVFGLERAEPQTAGDLVIYEEEEIVE
ncbi:hypothetical protein HYZ78_00360 [Candidatus Microgenomates bacterium]|nr:hypothetical protein [Candidatus Microgenomates bacterium]